MEFFIRFLIGGLIIAVCALIGRRSPSLAGLIAVMPLTTLLVMIFIHIDNPGDSGQMHGYVKGVLWGIIPTGLFFLTALFCFHRQVVFWRVVAAAFAVWLAAAIVHQLLLKP
jgi:uncharacterized membrane protein (GlpM family)